MTDIELVFVLLARLRPMRRFDPKAVEQALGIRMDPVETPNGAVAQGSLPGMFSKVRTAEVWMHIEGRTGLHVEMADGIDIPQATFVERWGPFEGQGVKPPTAKQEFSCNWGKGPCWVFVWFGRARDRALRVEFMSDE